MSASEMLLVESVGCFLTHLLDSTHPTEISGSAFCARSALKRNSKRSFSSSVRSSALRGLKGWDRKMRKQASVNLNPANPPADHFICKTYVLGMKGRKSKAIPMVATPSTILQVTRNRYQSRLSLGKLASDGGDTYKSHLCETHRVGW